MITQKEDLALRELSENLSQLLYKFEEFYSKAKEPQLKEDLQKLIASLKNQKRSLERERSGEDSENVGQ